GPDHRPEAIIPADVITAQEGTIAGHACRSGERPFRRELEFAVAGEIAAPVLLLGSCCGSDGNAGTAGDIAGHLQGAIAGQSAIFDRSHWRRFGIEEPLQSEIL